MTEKQQFTIDEICLLGEVTKRTLRYYVQEGLIDRPHGESKRAAYYTSEHLEQLLQIRKYRQMGISLEGIRSILEQTAQPERIIGERPRQPGTVEVWSRVFLSEGLEVHIEPGRAGLNSGEVKQLIADIKALYSKTRGE